MSVFTTVSRPELEQFLDGYEIGPLREFEGIAAGIENTNYFVATSEARCVLTVFEKLASPEIPFFLELKAYLAAHGFRCAEPLRRRDGGYLGEVQGKPAALVRRLYGHSVTEPRPVECEAVGQALGELHVLARGFTRTRANDRGPAWWKAAAAQLKGHLSLGDEALLNEELRFQGLYRLTDAPRGLIHADLFRDNALFEQGVLTGVIDFYYACTDVLLYDVAVAINDWASEADGRLAPTRAAALLRGYRAVRPLLPIEYGAWPALLRAGALRFWLSRLLDWHFPREGEMTHRKDPGVFRRILVARASEAGLARALWGEHGRVN